MRAPDLRRGTIGGVAVAGAVAALVFGGPRPGDSVIGAAQPPIPTRVPLAPPTIVIEVSSAESADQARELAERMLSSQTALNASVGPVASQVQLLPSRLPSGLPIDVPLPAGARGVGSVLRRYEGRSRELEVFAETSESAAAVQALYEQELRSRGWYQPPPGPGSGRFPVPEVRGFLDLCQSDQGVDRRWVGQIGPRDEATTSVHLRIILEVEQGTNCSTYRGSRVDLPAHPGPWGRTAQVLRHPDGPRPSTAGRRSADDGRWGLAEAILDTSLSLADLEHFYTQQLEEAGWQRLAGQPGERLRWSTWQLTGPGDWRGFFLVSDTARPTQRRVFLQVEAPTPPADPQALPPLIASLVSASLMEGMDPSEIPVYPTATIGPAALERPGDRVPTPGTVSR